jgi:hypothetical protein
MGGRGLAEFISFEGWQVKLNASEHDASIVAPPSLVEFGALDLHNYDFIFLYGCQLLSSGFGMNWINLVASSTKGLTEAVWCAQAIDYIRRSDHYAMVNSIKNKELLARLISMPCPLPNITKPQYSAISNVAMHRVRHLFSVAEQEMIALGVRFSQLPTVLLDSSGYATAASFKNKRPDDYVHLNQQGGELVAERMIEIAIGLHNS